MIPRQLRTALLFAAAGAAAFSNTLVVPNSQATAPGNAPVKLGGNASRVQEVLGSGQFSQFIGPVTITALRLRAAPGAGPANSTSTSVQVTLSTTQAYPNTNNGHMLPSVTYANNTGPDATVVYKGAGAISSPGCAAPGPCPFDIVIPFAAPFTYDPNQGRLLIDIVGSAPAAHQGSLDGVAYPDPSGSVVTISGDPTQPAGVLNLGGFVVGIDTGLTYYFPQLAFGGGWQTTLTYVNYAPQSTSCQTTFYANSGAALTVPFGGAPQSMRTDALAPGATLHQQTTADPSAAVTSAWAVALCDSPVQASILYRYYNQGVAQGEAGVNASTAPTTEFVTFAQTNTGIAYANPSTAPATVTITALNASGTALGSNMVALAPNAHGAANVGPLLGLNSFTGSVQITSTVPIVSLSLNAEAFPVFSALPPGDLPAGTPLAPGH
jgi:hypothetical protein